MAGAASDKKAFDIVIMDMKKMSSVCNYFVIASGASTTQVRAIADHIEDRLRQHNERPRHREGSSAASWLLLDYGDVVAHLFLEPTRRFYDLEELWHAAPKICFEEKEAGGVRRKPHRKIHRKLKKKKKIVRKRSKKKR